ncbi:MAG: type II toxin-antitoxin system PemK/MazF family toxin [Flavisolibacter sp.]|nr:type II toxin-antitoxin system PemK/MazF family toxin [Flavisolibacter sp.]
MYKQREIVLVPFPFSDLSSSKKRPVLILSNSAYNNKFSDVLVCVITSNLFQDDYSVSLNNDDLEVGILPEQSIIKCHKLFTIEQSQIIKRFSMISGQKFEEVCKRIVELIQPLL